MASEAHDLEERLRNAEVKKSKKFTPSDCSLFSYGERSFDLCIHEFKKSTFSKTVYQFIDKQTGVPEFSLECGPASPLIARECASQQARFGDISISYGLPVKYVQDAFLIDTVVKRIVDSFATFEH
jgi:hypothetical protein